jgi:hypothetical protein
MMPRAPEAEALYEGYAQRGFEVLSLDGSPFLQVPQPPMKPQGYPKPCGGGGSPSIATGLETCGSEAKQPKQKNISDNQ